MLLTTNIDDIVYTGATDVVRQSKTLAGGVHGFESGTISASQWPIIQAFDFCS